MLSNPDPLNKLCVLINVKDQRSVNRKPMYLIIMSQYCNCGKIKGKYKDYMIVKLAFALERFISFLTPCVLPIIPGYISYITGKN